MTNKQIATKEKADTVRSALEKLKPQLAMALPRHLTPDRLLRVTMTAVQQTPKLLECDRTSLYAAVLTCAQLGLEPDGVLGQAYLVPFKGKVQFIPGYRGLITLARNSGDISSIQAHEVCEHDDFDYAYGLEERLHHRPAEGDRGEITHFYAYAKFKDGGHIFEVMTRAEVEKVRDNSEGYKAFKAGHIKSNPWDSDFVPMGRKTLVRRIAKYLPLQVQRAAEFENALDRGQHATTDDYGDVVIEGESQEVTGEEGQQGNGAASKLDALAGEEEGQGEPEKETKSSKKKTKTTKKKASKKAPKGNGDFFMQEQDDGSVSVIEQETGEVVPDEYVVWHDDGTFSVTNHPKDTQEGPDEPGLFSDEG